MGNEIPPKNEQPMESEDSTPVFPKIKYELSDSATAKPATSKPLGAYNTSYYAANHAAKVASQEQFSLTDVRLEQHHKELNNRLKPVMFFSAMGDTSELYNRTVAEVAIVHSSQEDSPIYDNIGLEKFKVSVYCCVRLLLLHTLQLHGSVADGDHTADVQLLGVRCKDVCLVLFCEWCSQCVSNSQLCPDCKGPVSIKYFQR